MRALRDAGIDNQMAVLLAAVSTLLASLSIRSLLPEQFLRDDALMQQTIQYGSLIAPPDSFELVGQVYEVLGLDAAPPLAALVGVSLYVGALLAAVGWGRVARLSAPALALTLAFFVPPLVYLAQYSKELVTVGLTLLVLTLPDGRGRSGRAAGELAVVGAALAYGALLRPYWLIVAAVYIAWRILLPRTAHPAMLLLVPALVYTALQPVFRRQLGHGLQGQRDWANAERADDQVNTLIQSVSPDAEGAAGVFAALAMLGLMVLPVPLLASGEAFQLASGAAIAGIWALVLVPVLSARLLDAGTAGAVRAAPAGRTVRAVRAASLLLAFLTVQALFEPDYGSALKHLTPLLPLVLAVHLHRRRS
ncbi:hypothetical protein [Nesterenkonia halobia]|uniref:Glycosyltransferase RgtA/B/C/D-like domain-containing protein n=1 Tax=Nesterenkonia halobia TaxID=37922 RepID=A0ABP6RME2_9MICC